MPGKIDRRQQTKKDEQKMKKDEPGMKKDELGMKKDEQSPRKSPFPSSRGLARLCGIIAFNDAANDAG